MALKEGLRWNSLTRKRQENVKRNKILTMLCVCVQFSLGEYGADHTHDYREESRFSRRELKGTGCSPPSLASSTGIYKSPAREKGTTQILHVFYPLAPGTDKTAPTQVWVWICGLTNTANVLPNSQLENKLSWINFLSVCPAQMDFKIDPKLQASKRQSFPCLRGLVYNGDCSIC